MWYIKCVFEIHIVLPMTYDTGVTRSFAQIGASSCGHKIFRPQELAPIWAKDLVTRPDRSIKVG